MKKFVIFAFLSFFMINISLLGSSSDCAFTGPLCTTNETYDEVEVYPGCFIYVRYDVITCPGGNTQIVFLGYGFNFTSPNPCLPLYQQIFPFYPNRNIMDDMAWLGIKNYIQETIINKEVDKIASSSTNGKDDFLCGGTNIITITYHTKVCEAWCFKDAKFIADPITGNPILHAPFDNMVNVNPQEPIIVAQSVSCSEYCCASLREYCYEKVLIGGEFQYIKHYNETKTANNEYMGCDLVEPEECVLPPYYQPYLIPGLLEPWFHVTDCFDKCDGGW